MDAQPGQVGADDDEEAAGGAVDGANDPVRHGGLLGRLRGAAPTVWAGARLVEPLHGSRWWHRPVDTIHRARDAAFRFKQSVAR